MCFLTCFLTFIMHVWKLRVARHFFKKTISLCAWIVFFPANLPNDKNYSVIISIGMELLYGDSSGLYN